jgi:hypothetical protein
MLTNKWGKRIASLISMMFVLMLLVSTLSVTVFAAETVSLATASEESGGNFWVITLGVVAAVLLLVCAVLVYLLKTQKEGFLGKIAELQHKYKALGKLQNETQQNFDYAEINGLRIEAVQKLNKYQPLNIGQASRISGVSPADTSVILVYLEQLKYTNPELFYKLNGNG